MTETKQSFSYIVEESAHGDIYVSVKENGNDRPMRSERSILRLEDFAKEKLGEALAEYRGPNEIPTFLRVVAWKGHQDRPGVAADFIIERHTIKPPRTKIKTQ